MGVLERYAYQHPRPERAGSCCSGARRSNPKRSAPGTGSSPPSRSKSPRRLQLRLTSTPAIPGTGRDGQRSAKPVGEKSIPSRFRMMTNGNLLLLNIRLVFDATSGNSSPPSSPEKSRYSAEQKPAYAPNLPPLAILSLALSKWRKGSRFA